MASTIMSVGGTHLQETFLPRRARMGQFMPTAPPSRRPRSSLLGGDPFFANIQSMEMLGKYGKPFRQRHWTYGSRTTRSVRKLRATLISWLSRASTEFGLMAARILV